MNKKTVIIIVIIGIIVISFGLYTILPYFTNTVVDEPLPSASGINLNNDVLNLNNKGLTLPATSSAQIQEDNKVKFDEIQYKIDKSQFKQAPEFSDPTGFVNTNSTTLADLKGKVVLVHFWTYTCINCIHTVPFLNDWYQKYSDKGFVIVGIHTPEFEFEKKLNNVKNAAEEFEIKYPVVQDNNYNIWNAYGNKYWPRDYLIDKDGYIRYNHVGEGGYNQTEGMIQLLIQEDQTNLGANSTGKPIS